MEKKSTYKNQMIKNFELKTAIIISADDLCSYIINIRDQNKNYFISNKNELIKFGNMQNARRAALKEGVKEIYLALSKTYEETDASTCHANHQDRYEYLPILRLNDDIKSNDITVDKNELIDEASKESFPASDPPAWIHRKF